MSPEEIVRTVFARVRAADITVAELYRPDATLIANDGRHEGREAITAFYQARFQTRPQPQVQDLFVHLPYVVAVVEVTDSNGGVHRAADIFEVEGTAIRSIRVCNHSA